MKEGHLQSLLVLMIGITIALSYQLLNLSPHTLDLHGKLSNQFQGLRLFNSNVYHFFDNLVELNSIASKNVDLNSEVIELQERVVELELELAKSEYLVAYSATGLVSEVVNARQTYNSGILYLASGKLDSVEVGDLVVVGKFLVGRVIEVGDGYSKAKLIIASDSKYTVQVGTRLAVAYGIANLSVELRNIDQVADIKVGEEIKVLPTTESPLLGRYSIGKVSKVDAGTSSSVKHAEVDYPIRIADLQIVEIIKSK